MHIAILGGGLMGTASAFFLLTHPKAPKSLKVTLIDRGAIGAGATVASFGNVRRQGRDFRQMALAHHSLALWIRLETLLGRDVEFRATGHVRAVFHQEALKDMQNFASAALQHGLEIDQLDQADIRRRFPFLSKDVIAGSFSPQDGSGNPRLVAPAFARAAVRHGLVLRDHTQVVSIRPASSGFRIEAPDEVIEADLLLNTAGAWGGQVADRLGEPAPLTPYAPQMGVTEPLEHRILPVVGVWAHKAEEVIYCRQVERGNIVFGGGPREDVTLTPGHAKVNPHRTLRQLEVLTRLIPALRHTTVIRTWSGCEGYVDDMLPVMGPSARHDGLFHAFGFCGHGFQLGPGVGAEMAELILTGASLTDTNPFHIARFQNETNSGI
ncbi:MAG: FAD-binding oxidoreductase [Rhodobacteraceae bacterium]|nr:FAD-binding oxidoreductase [Paracoccaceae bacterium]